MFLGRPAVLALALILAWAGAAAALSPEQVIKLRKAGVSNQTIQKMIETEMAVTASGRQGSYVVKGHEGKSWIVYEAGGFGGGGVTSHEPGIKGSERSLVRVSEILRPAGGKSGRYALLVSSHRKKAGAQAQAKKISATGLAARVATVDLPQKGRWHRVLVGSFSGRGAAKSAGDSLKAEGKLPGYTIIKQ